ncbi:unnamed protein product, partial [Prorocentrum cordatum]
EDLECFAQAVRRLCLRRHQRGAAGNRRQRAVQAADLRRSAVQLLGWQCEGPDAGGAARHGQLGPLVLLGQLQQLPQGGDLQVTHQTMILVDTMGETDTHLKADGILGLGPESVASDTFVAKLFLQYPELPKQFSFFLSRFLEQPSHLLIGEADLASYSKESAFQYSTSWHGSRSRTWLAGMWSIGWTGTDVIAYNASGGMDPTLVMGMPTLVDSGTSLIVVSAGIYDRLVPELAWRMGSCRHNDEEDILECQCPPLNDLSKLPWLALTFVDESGEHFVLSMAPDEYIIEAAGEDYPGQR